MTHKKRIFDQFATRIMHFDCTDEFSAADLDSMVDCIDAMAKDGSYIETSDSFPPLQSKPVMFNEQIVPGEEWGRLRRSFINCCQMYLVDTPDFCKHRIEEMSIADVRAWFYRSNQDSFQSSTNPYHDHAPAFLSGVFYLRLPQCTNPNTGTDFRDTRHMGRRDVHVPGVTAGWAIFPGWCEHRAGRCDTKQYRYVIAADMYVSINA